MIILLIALSLVRERERGTLEQLTMTPVAPLGLMVGKMIPYGVLGFGELCLILTIMRIVFQVPIHGNVFVLLGMSLPFLLTILGVGLFISTKARTQAEAFQLSMGTILPSASMILTSRCGWTRPMVETRRSSGSSTALWKLTGLVSVMP